MRTIAHNIFLRLKKFFQLLSLVVVGLLLVLPHLWVGSLFKWQQSQLKTSLIQRLSARYGNEQRVDFSFDSADFNAGKIEDFYWRNETEFTYKGIFYDVLQTEFSETRILIKAFADFEETISNTRQKEILATLWKNQNNPNKTGGFFGILKSFFLSPSINHSLLTQPSKDVSHTFACQQSLYTFLYADLSDRPPQLNR